MATPEGPHTGAGENPPRNHDDHGAGPAEVPPVNTTGTAEGSTPETESAAALKSMKEKHGGGGEHHGESSPDSDHEGAADTHEDKHEDSHKDEHAKDAHAGGTDGHGGAPGHGKHHGGHGHGGKGILGWTWFFLWDFLILRAIPNTLKTMGQDLGNDVAKAFGGKGRGGDGGGHKPAGGHDDHGGGGDH